MNDELTPSERSALRAQILGGARGIKPVGAHRNAVIAGSIAAVLVVAIAGGVAATSTLSAPPVATTPSPSATVSIEPAPTPTPTATPTSTPSPLPTTPTPTVAFDGDCEALLGIDEARGFVDGVEPWTRGNTVKSTPPSRSKAYALLGGMSCWWTAESDGFGISVLPRSVVPSAVIDQWSAEPSCDSGILCVAEQTVGGLWVGVQWFDPAWQRQDTANIDPAEIERVRDSGRQVLAAVAPRVRGASGVPEPGLPTTPLPECSAFDDTIAQWAQVDIEPGYPSDNVPSGPLWDLTVAAGIDRYCGWNHFPADPTARTLAVRFYIEPLRGSPSFDEWESAPMTPVEIPGTSSAWMEESSTYPGTVSVIAVVDGARLSVVGSTRDTAEWIDLVSRVAGAYTSMR